MIPYNKTKIVATIGPASSSPEMLKQLMEAGVDVCRLNLSHGDYTVHQKVIEDIRSISRELNANISILVDLQGPKLRIGEVENNEMILEAGQEIVFTSHECVGKNGRLYMNYQQFPQDVAIGDLVLIDDGKIQLRVISTNRLDEVHAIAESRGKISFRKGVNLSRTKISLPSLIAKDLDDLSFVMD